MEALAPATHSEEASSMNPFCMSIIRRALVAGSIISLPLFGGVSSTISLRNGQQLHTAQRLLSIIDACMDVSFWQASGFAAAGSVGEVGSESNEARSESNEARRNSTALRADGVKKKDA